MFNNFPTKIKKMIFARVRLMDLYEVSSVSKEWWALTMATCSPTSDKYSPFLYFQLQFCNKMMPKEGGWEDWMFIEFTDDKSIKLLDYPDEKLVGYLRQKGIQVRKLIFDGGFSILRNLKELFPYLETLDITFELLHSDFCEEVIALPDGLKHLQLTVRSIDPKSHLLDVFKQLECVDSLYIANGQRIIFDNISFRNLKQLHLDMSKQSAKDIKSLVNDSKQLSVVYLKCGLISKGWRGLFPTNIKKIHLKKVRFDKEKVRFQTDGAFVERHLMRYVCQDWTKLCLFKSSDWSYVNDYNHTYVCRPAALEEELLIVMQSGGIPSGLLHSGKLQLKVLKFYDDRNTKRYFHKIVPKSVKHFVWEAQRFEALNFAELFEDISTIEALRIHSFQEDKIHFSGLLRASSLVSLHISNIDDIILASIIRNCPSLKQLSVNCPQGMPFSILPEALKSPSVKELFIHEPKDSITNILGHFPGLVNLHLQRVHLESVTIIDLASLMRVDFVRISFKNGNSVALMLLMDILNLLPFSHIMMGFSSCLPCFENERLFCVIGREKAFFRKYSSSPSKNDFIRMNIHNLLSSFPGASLLYLKGVSCSHLISLPEFIKITYDLQEFIAKALAEYQIESNDICVLH